MDTSSTCERKHTANSLQALAKAYVRSMQRLHLSWAEIAPLHPLREDTRTVFLGTVNNRSPG